MGLHRGYGPATGGAVGTIAWVRDGHLTIFHAGDTTCMLLRLDEEPKLLTSLHEYDGCISRYFGLGRRLEIEVRHERLIDGDLILLVSDGVMKVLSTTDMTSLVQGVYARTGDIGNAARELVTLARVRKSADDITAMVIEVLDE